MIRVLGVVLISGSIAVASTVQEEKLKLFEEARNVEVRSVRGEAWEVSRRALDTQTGGNPNSNQILEMMRNHRDYVGKRDKAIRTPVPTLETNINVLEQQDPECGVADEGLPIQVLSYSVMYNEGDGKGARWGHIMQRFEYCRDGKYFSFVFTEGPVKSEELITKAVNEYQVTPEEIQLAPKQKGGVLFTWMVGDHRKEFRRRIVTEKRTLYEVQFDLEPVQVYWALLFNVANYKIQKNQLLSGEKLPAYSTISNNCAHGFLETINQLVPGYSDNGYNIRPIDVYRYASQRLAKRVIVYPKEAYLER